MNCPGCERPVTTGSLFCNMCGSPIADPENSIEVVVSAFEGISADFVGRESEIKQLISAVDAVESRKVQLVMLVGEPGIGKTRTVDEIAAHAKSRGFVVFRGACYEEQIVPAFWPWVQVLRSHIFDTDPQILAAQMGAGAPYIAEIIP